MRELLISPGHGDGFYNNTCLAGVGGMRKPSGCGDPSCFVMPATDLDDVGHVGQCDPSIIKLGGNKYYTPNGNATLSCGGRKVSIAQAQVCFWCSTTACVSILSRSPSPPSYFFVVCVFFYTRYLFLSSIPPFYLGEKIFLFMRGLMGSGCLSSSQQLSEQADSQAD